MSAILEALKRIEREPQQSLLESLPQQLDPRKSLEKRVRKRWFRRRLMTVLFLLPILGVGTWVAIQHKFWLSRGTGVPAAASGVNGVKSKPPAAAPRITKRQPSSLSMSEKRRGQAGVPAPRTRENPGLAPGGDRSARSSPAPTKQKTTEAAPAVQGERSAAPSPEDPEFKLDALVWSSNPKSRFAVINGQIVRAGETIKGASIAQIERDHVRLKSGSRDWELRLNIQPKSP